MRGSTTQLTHMIYHLQQAVQHAVIVRDRLDTGNPQVNAYLEILNDDLAQMTSSYQGWLEDQKELLNLELTKVLAMEDLDGNPF